MKEPDMRLTGRGRRIDRALGDAPSLGHVERMYGSNHLKDPLGENQNIRQRRHRDQKRSQQVVVAWSAVFALVALSCIAIAFGVWMYRAWNLTSDATLTTAEPRGASRAPSPSKEFALDWVQRALQVRDPARVPEFFRPGATTAEAVATFLETMEASDGPITKYTWLSAMDANGLPLDGVAVYTKTAAKLRYRLALLTPDEAGHWKIDFEAFARIVSPSWPEILAAGSDQNHRVRILFAKDTYFNGPFTGEDQWLCYRLASPDLTDDLLGYCRRDSPQADAMNRIVTAETHPSKSKNPYRATLEIRRPKDAEARQFEITRVLAEDWVLADKPFDEAQK